jgi:hypothetical protein
MKNDREDASVDRDHWELTHTNLLFPTPYSLTPIPYSPMSTAYTPGLLVTPRTWWRCRRMLPIKGRVLTQVGAMVDAQQVVAETEMPGDPLPVNVAKLLGVTPAQVPKSLLVKPGDRVELGEPLAHSAGLFGWFPRDLRSPVSGTVETASAITGQVIIRGAPVKVQVRAYLSGKVAEVLPEEGVVIEASSAVIQGIFGIGGEAYGPLQLAVSRPDEDLTETCLKPEQRGAVVIGGRRITRAAVDQARELGIAALVAGGIDDHDLKEILGYDLGVAVTGMEQLGLTVIVTEGFGDIAMASRTFKLFQQLAGQPAAVNGTTQIRAGVLRPEIVVPLTGNAAGDETIVAPTGTLAIGAPLRIIREPYFGALGVVEALPSEPQMLASQSKARVVVVKLQQGTSVTVPRANVELMEGAAT